VNKSLSKAKAPLSLLELAACELAFACFALPSVFTGLAPSETALGSGIAGLFFWWGFQWGTPQTGTSVLQPAFVGTGMALLVESLMVYSELSAPMSLLSLAGGCLGAALLNQALRKWLIPRSTDGRVVLLGCGAVGASVVAGLGPQLMGVVEESSKCVPAGAAYLGGFTDLNQVIEARHPASLVLDLSDWDQHFSPRYLLDRKLEGTKIETAATAYERLLHRISVEVYQPFHFWQETLRSNRRIMAFQAIYSNLSGLILLVGLSPVLVVLGLAARLAAGPGPVFESIVCAGFQRIPFSRRRFRIHRAGSGTKTAIGKLISGLRLTNLPQLINLVRGEMGLFGPEPVRAEFAEYLEELSPIYSLRFSMKPGVFGWAQANARRYDPSGKATKAPLGGALQEENVRIGYDLYYLEYGSPLVDLEILLGAFVRRITAWKR
jgi:lipopolysaccharide/colanic/teichoic acid biosynthesis glycosyltransferase